jgi:hypothetical protein
MLERSTRSAFALTALCQRPVRVGEWNKLTPGAPLIWCARDGHFPTSIRFIAVIKLCARFETTPSSPDRARPLEDRSTVFVRVRA